LRVAESLRATDRRLPVAGGPTALRAGCVDWPSARC